MHKNGFWGRRNELVVEHRKIHWYWEECMNKCKYWVGLSLVAGVGPIRLKRLVEHFGSPERAWKASKEELKVVPGINSKQVQEILKTRVSVDLERFLRYCKEEEIHLLTPEDSEFPANLRHIFDPPPVIYYRGTLMAEDVFSVAIVGSRKMTAYGRRVTRKLARDLVVKGFTIVSGMALGIDGVAHQAALEAGGRTIAVLGSGLNQIYPREHTQLYHEIIRSGVVLSTYPPETFPEKGHFPARNRIISGLSLGTVVVEAGKRSGALITADQALEQNREIFAVPGSIFNNQSHGTNALIQKGAKLITSAQDISDELGELAEFACQRELSDGRSVEKLPAITLVQTQVLSILEGGEVGFDQLLEQTQISVSELNAVLLELELMGLIFQEPGLKFTIC